MATIGADERSGAGDVRDEVTLFRMLTLVTAGRARIFKWMLIVAVLAALPRVLQAPRFKASTSFTPQGAESSRSAFASLVGQLGVALPAGDMAKSPQFYADLLQTRELLRPLLLDTLIVAEEGGRRATLIELLKIEDPNRERALDKGVKALRGLVKTAVNKPIGVVSLAVSTRWPSVSLEIVKRLMDGVNRFDLRTRRSQAAEERKFVEARLTDARQGLRLAEDRVEAFMTANRQPVLSPSLAFQRERLMRELALEQQVYSTLVQSLEAVRIREVRETTLITYVEAPSISAQADSRGRAILAAFGLVLGGLLGVIEVLVRNAVATRIASGDAAAEQWLEQLRGIREVSRRFVRRLLGRRRSEAM